MTTENLTLLNGFTKKIDWIEARQKTLAEGIANADTPGYRPSDLVPLDFKELLGGSTSKLSLAAAGRSDTLSPLPPTSLGGTNASHLDANGSKLEQRAADSKAQRKTYETAPVGNAVVLEEQLLKMGENFADHRMMTNLYQKNIDMLKLSVK